MAFSLDRSQSAFAEAKQYIPGGVNSPVRSFRSVGGTPPFIEKATGSKIYDIDGNAYIDYVGSYGPMILGHAHPAIVTALCEAAQRGTSYGAPTIQETELAKMVMKVLPSIEMLRMVNSGTEATMSALRLARAFTGRDKIVKFEGCYHGHHDSLLVKAGSGATTFGVPDSPGVPQSVAQNTITVPYNNIEELEAAFKASGEEIAAVIIEPTPGNMGLILPKEGYLQQVQAVCQKHGALLIFDEVMSGFRSAYGGSQAVYGIKPDLTCLGKVIGGGLPVAAYGGRRDIMEQVSPAGPMYQAGTLSGNPLAMAAGIATMKLLGSSNNFFVKLNDNTIALTEGLRTQAERVGLNLQFHRIGSMFSMFFSNEPVYDYQSACKSNVKAFNVYFHSMLEQGIYLAPSQFETGFMSAAHSDADIAITIKASAKAFQKVVEVCGK
ncbi:MAG: glutamate-1-semialdehyde 2,1-aminomutase [Pelosinus sp.]|nr:glutamate-1-semialdehyde 2,1-aminomutase [Pelosinus sp.]